MPLPTLSIPQPTRPAVRFLKLGNKHFRLPLRASHYWVEDAAGSNVCEACSVEVARALASLLTQQAQTP